MLDRTVHVEDQLLHRAALADWIHPLAGHRYHGGEVIRMGQYFGLEPVDLTGGSSLLALSPTADDVAHHRIDAQSFGVIHIFVARQLAVDRLTQHRPHVVLNVAAGVEIEQLGCAGYRQLRRLIEVTVGE